PALQPIRVSHIFSSCLHAHHIYATLYTYSITSSFFFFNATPTTEIYTLSLHDALPISVDTETGIVKVNRYVAVQDCGLVINPRLDRKSTRLNSSHVAISYAVFCLKKKKTLNACRWRYARTPPGERAAEPNCESRPGRST